MANPITWIEIPVLDMDRAIKFYKEVMDWEITPTPMGDVTMGWLPYDKDDERGASGTLIHNKNYTPSEQSGVLIYFTCKDVAERTKRIAAAGGQVLEDKKQISPEHGFMGLALDSEGNRIAFHSYK